MKTGITAKLKLHTTPEQFAALRATQLAYRDALNYVSQYAFTHSKMSNKVKLQDGTYDEVRARFHLPSQMACSVPRQVGATYKGLWKKVKQNAAARKAGHTKKRYKGLDKVWWYQKSRQFSGKNKTKLNCPRNAWLSFQIHLCWCVVLKRLMQTLMIVKREILTQIAYSIGNTLIVFNIHLLVFNAAPQSFDENVV